MTTFRELLDNPVICSPMAGGVSTPELVAAVAEAGGFALLAAGYKTAAAMEAEIATAAALTPRFGINVFVPGEPTSDPAALAAYLSSLAPDVDELGVDPGEAVWNDDDWEAKIAALLAHPVPLVSFTFGCPGRELIEAFAAAGSLVCVTVTHSDEARLATERGADCLAVQGIEAGAHRGTFHNGHTVDQHEHLNQLVGAVHAVSHLPVIAAGGIMDADAAAGALHSGASAVQCGTAFLRCPESGAHPAYKAALVDARFDQTAVTRAFSGRPARALVNRFMLDHPDAPAAYPEINAATRPLRTAASAAGDADRMSLYAGTGYRKATDEAAGLVVERLCSERVIQAFRAS